LGVAGHDRDHGHGGRAPEPKVDLETGAVQFDRDTGEQLSLVQLVLMGEFGAEVIRVKVAGEPPKVVPGQLTVPRRRWWHTGGREPQVRPPSTTRPPVRSTRPASARRAWSPLAHGIASRPVTVTLCERPGTVSRLTKTPDCHCPWPK
jgi:hypothetical protein